MSLTDVAQRVRMTKNDEELVVGRRAGAALVRNRDDKEVSAP
jgi:hypothetical protein